MNKKSLNQTLIYNGDEYPLPDGYTRAIFFDTTTLKKTCDKILNSSNKECSLVKIEDKFYLLDPDYPCKRIELL